MAEMGIAADIAAEAVERVAGVSAERWVPRWGRWLAVCGLFVAALALWPPPAWLQAVTEVASASLVFSFTVGVVFAAYARKLGDEGLRSVGLFLFSFALFAVLALVLPSLAKPSTVMPSTGYLIGLALTMLDGGWAFAQRALSTQSSPRHGPRPVRTAQRSGAPPRLEPWASWAMRATVLGLGAATTLAAAFVAGAPFFIERQGVRDPRWPAIWGAGFCAYGLVVSALQAIDAQAGTTGDERSWPKQVIVLLLMGCFFVVLPVAVFVAYRAGP